MEAVNERKEEVLILEVEPLVLINTIKTTAGAPRLISDKGFAFQFYASRGRVARKTGKLYQVTSDN